MVGKKCRQKLFLVSTRTEKAERIAVVTYFYFNHQLRAANLAIKLVLIGMENARLQNQTGNFGACRMLPSGYFVRKDGSSGEYFLEF